MDSKAAQFRDEGFTLIELLVVIAVLALLLSVILPSLNNAKMIAKKVVCASKMRQWALAQMTYTSENNGVVTPLADTTDSTKGGAALNFENYWYNRLSPYLTDEYSGQWGRVDLRRCPAGKPEAVMGEKAGWIGVYYGLFNPEKGPFVFTNTWNGTVLTKKCDPVKMASIKMPASYLMMLDTNRDVVLSPMQWKWDADYDGDLMHDSRQGLINAKLGPFNMAQPKFHRDGCNVALFDGRVEWIAFKEFWGFTDGYPTHRYWYNGNRPAPVAASPASAP